MDVLGMHLHLWLTIAGVMHVKLDRSSMYHRMATRLASGSFTHRQPGSDRTLLGRALRTQLCKGVPRLHPHVTSLSEWRANVSGCEQSKADT